MPRGRRHCYAESVLGWSCKSLVRLVGVHVTGNDKALAACLVNCSHGPLPVGGGVLDDDTCSSNIGARLRGIADAVLDCAPAALGRRRIPLAAAYRQTFGLIEAVSLAHLLASKHLCRGSLRPFFVHAQIGLG